MATPPVVVEARSVLDEEVSNKLYAARPLSWKGGSDLPQLPWAAQCSGLVLVIDLWAGLGGLLISLLALGIRCIVLSAEQDADLRNMKTRLFPNLVEISSVESIHAEMLQKVMKRRSFAAGLIGG